MNYDKLKRQITHQAAQLLVSGRETDYHQAKLAAGRHVCQGWVKPDLLPSDQELRDEIAVLARTSDAASLPSAAASDRFALFRSLLLPLETVQQKPEYHPEGDALYHSLQVFELALKAQPYDEEFLLAALLHDVGKGIDPKNHIEAALTALDGHITPRTAWLIENHSNAGALRDGRLGLRARKRLEASEDFDDLMLLCDCDRGGRQPGAQVQEVDEVLAHLRELSQSDE